MHFVIDFDTERDDEYCARCGKELGYPDEDIEEFTKYVTEELADMEGGDPDDYLGRISPTDYKYYNLCGTCAGVKYMEEYLEHLERQG